VECEKRKMSFQVNFSASDEIEESPGHSSDIAGMFYMNHAIQAIFSGISQRFNGIPFPDHVARSRSSRHGIGKAVSPH
jgi:hypothetical protein